MKKGEQNNAYIISYSDYKNSNHNVCKRSYNSNNLTLYRLKVEEKKMIKIIKPEDINKISEQSIVPYIKDLLNTVQNAYCADDSIEAVGAIYYFETFDDFNKYKDIGLFAPITEDCFEYIIDIGNGYSDGCMAINNDYAINIISKTVYFKHK